MRLKSFSLLKAASMRQRNLLDRATRPISRSRSFTLRVRSRSFGHAIVLGYSDHAFVDLLERVISYFPILVIFFMLCEHP